jgi:hypothetical protein
MKDIDELNPILEIGAEGGSITVVSRPSPGGPPEYSVRIRDQTLTFLPTEEGGNQIRTQTAWLLIPVERERGFQRIVNTDSRRT